MDWLLDRQKTIETKLAKRHLTDGGLVLYDVSSSSYEGKTCPRACYGHDRDGKTGCPILVSGALTDADGRPVAVQVYPGNTGDPKTIPWQWSCNPGPPGQAIRAHLGHFKIPTPFKV